MKEKVLGEMKNAFRPEFLNRIDATVVFTQLSREQIREIVDLLLARVKAQLAGQQMELVVTDAAKDAIIAKGYDHAFGARPLRREIQNQIEDPLAERMLMASFEAGDTIVVDADPDGGPVDREEAGAPAGQGPMSADRRTDTPAVRAGNMTDGANRRRPLHTVSSPIACLPSEPSTSASNAAPRRHAGRGSARRARHGTRWWRRSSAVPWPPPAPRARHGRLRRSAPSRPSPMSPAPRRNAW